MTSSKNLATTNLCDERYMRLALCLAQRGLGTTAPNPSVGCVIVKDNRIIGQGVTAPGGRPHAETQSLQQAGAEARGATAYVTLEPCSHHGKTPPCAEALMEAGVARVVVALEDCDSRVAGRGIAQMRDMGITVDVGLCRDEARALNAGFFSVHERRRPLVTLKLATSLDGKIATASGESKWITGDAARRYAHLLRAEHDAIMVGIGTVLADNPSLTCRLPGLEDRNPIPVVMDSRLRLPKDSQLAHSASLVLTCESRQLAHPVTTIQVPAQDGHINPTAALTALADGGITRLLVEGGGRLAASLLKADLVDHLIWIQAPKIIGADGKPAVAELGLERLHDASHWQRISMRLLSEDSVMEYKRIR